MPTINKIKKKALRASTYISDKDKIRREIYNSKRWRILRAIKFKNSPLCEMCLKKEVVKLAQDIHHVNSFVDAIDKAKRIQLAYDYNNLLSLCKECHQLIHNSHKYRSISGEISE